MPWSSSPWTPARIERLTVLWKRGFSAGLIAIELNTTRNAVVGKIHRLGLEWRPQHFTRHRGRAQPKNPLMRKPPPRPSVSRNEPPTPTHVRFMARRHGQCAAILNDGQPVADLIVCGARVPLESQFQFCAAHLAVFTVRRK